MKMTNSKFLDLANRDKDYIEKYELETSEGTKKYKRKFYVNAVDNRNAWINNKILLYENFDEQVRVELKNRKNVLMPDNLSNKFSDRKNLLDEYLYCIIAHNTDINIGFRLKLDFYIASITEGISLEYLNSVLKKYIEIFLKYGIKLSNEDFNYSVFTKEFMDNFFENNEEVTLKNFEKVFFECPDFIHHIKMNLKNIIVKYKDILETSLLDRTDKKVQTFNASNLNLVDDYLKYKEDYKWDYLKDSYNNLQLFLNEKNINDYLVDCDIRKKNFTKFYPNYYELSYENKLKINDVYIDFYNTLENLNDFYRYKFILDDLIKRYGNKSNSKANFDSKNKEVIASDKLRIKLNEEYYNCFVSKLFKKARPEKAKLYKLQVNEEIVKLNKLYDEYYDFEFNKIISEKLNDASSIYDCFVLCLDSFSYLKNTFDNKFKDEEDYDLRKEFYRFINFLYSPYNKFMIKINAFADYDVCKVLTDKFVISGLSVTADDISVEGISKTYETMEYIIRCILLDDSFLDTNKLKFIISVTNLN